MAAGYHPLPVINSCASALEKLNDRLARRGVISELDDLKMRALSTGEGLLQFGSGQIQFS
jgi:hypothetical protein